jgi:CHAD domain-containing protein
VAKAREVPGLLAGDRFDVAARKVVATRADELIERLDAVREAPEPKRVFDARVASRRLRAALEIFTPAFPEERHRPLLRDVKRLAGALGQRRDPDVQLAVLEALRGELPEQARRGVDGLLAGLRAERLDGGFAVAEALAEAQASDLAGRLRALGEPEPEPEPESESEPEPEPEEASA